MKLKFPASLKVIGKSIVDWWDSWFDLVAAVLVWLVAQITIVFGPPATFGLVYTAHALINGESLGAKGIIEGGRKYFSKSWLWALLNILVVAIIYTNFYFYGQMDSVWGAYGQLFTIMIGTIWLVTQCYTVVYLMEMVEKRLFLAIRNGFFTTMASPIFSLLISLFALIVIILCAVTVLPIFFGLPALVPILYIRALYNRLEKYGLREREKSPKEIEREQSSRFKVPRMDEVADSEGQVQDQHR